MKGFLSGGWGEEGGCRGIDKLSALKIFHTSFRSLFQSVTAGCCIVWFLLETRNEASRDMNGYGRWNEHITGYTNQIYKYPSRILKITVLGLCLYIYSALISRSGGTKSEGQASGTVHRELYIGYRMSSTVRRVPYVGYGTSGTVRRVPYVKQRTSVAYVW